MFRKRSHVNDTQLREKVLVDNVALSSVGIGNFWGVHLLARCVFKQSSQMTPFMSLTSLAHIYIVMWQKKIEKKWVSDAPAGLWAFIIGTCKDRIVQNDKMAITILFSLKIIK